MDFKYLDNNEFNPTTLYVFKHALGWEFECKVAQEEYKNGQANGNYYTTNEGQQFKATSLPVRVK